jgi:cellulose synthase/poly-beta-1,6-N-acetylglucosamine synthase-like glycosyltransferase
MNAFAAAVILSVMLAATVAMTVFGIHWIVLLILAARRWKTVRRQQTETARAFHQNTTPDQWPTVTTQIPIYNERQVATRVIQAVADLDYPANKHQIQILDDSTDDTRAIIDAIADRLRAEGKTIDVVRRPTRTGYKAGALAHALPHAAGQLIAVFDADFVPSPDFLTRAIPHFAENDRIACVQGRWAHLNESESWLTKAQSLGIDTHFAIEQPARAWNGFLLNFNGTGGIWRRQAIEDPAVGGWQADTLTEDLDLSYRAQMAGWRIRYVLDLPVPAEIPSTALALKSQQRRWALGSMQTAVKLLPRIWSAPLKFSQKIEGSLHVTQYLICVWMLVLCLMAPPMLAIVIPDFSARWASILGPAWILILISMMGSPLLYISSRRVTAGSWEGIRILPKLMVLGAGMSLNNAVAAVEGLFRKGGEFVRTPKTGNRDGQIQRTASTTIRANLWWLELLLGTYSLINTTLSIWFGMYGVTLFLAIYTLGFLSIGWLSRPRFAAATDPLPAATLETN